MSQDSTALSGSEGLVERIVQDVVRFFPTFGGGRDSQWNPIAHALKDTAPSFAAGVDIAQVVAFVLEQSATHELLAACDEALGVLIACCIPAGGVDDRATILETQALLRAAIAKATGATPSTATTND